MLQGPPRRLRRVCVPFLFLSELSDLGNLLTDAGCAMLPADYEDEDKDVTVEAERAQLEPLEKDLREEPSKPFKGEDDERGELFAQDGGVTGEGIGTHTE